MSQAKDRGHQPGLLRLLPLVFLCAVFLVLAGCESGTLTDQEQACESSGGLLAEERVSCTGSVGTVSGSPQLTIVDADGGLEGTYTLDATISVGRGETKAHVTTVDGDRVGGEVSPDGPIRIQANVEVDDEDDEVVAELKVAGKRVTDLRYRAELAPQG